MSHQSMCIQLSYIRNIYMGFFRLMRRKKPYLLTIILLLSLIAPAYGQNGKLSDDNTGQKEHGNGFDPSMAQADAQKQKKPSLRVPDVEPFTKRRQFYKDHPAKF